MLTPDQAKTLVSNNSVSGPWGLAKWNWVHEDLALYGWKWWADKWYWPLFEKGVRRFLIRCGFGQGGDLEKGLFMRGDSYDHAPAPIVRDFVPAIGALVDRGCQVIWYDGPPTADMTWDTFHRNLSLPMEARCDFAFDAIVLQPDDGRVMKLAERLLNSSVEDSRIYVEGLPQKQYPGWSKFNAITLNPPDEYSMLAAGETLGWMNGGTWEQIQDRLANPQNGEDGLIAEVWEHLK